MPVYLPTAVLGTTSTLVTLGPAGEIMGWFWPSKDHAQHIHECLPSVYFGDEGQGRLSWTWSDEWHREQRYLGDSNICQSILTTHSTNFQISFTDVMIEGEATLLRRAVVRNDSAHHMRGSVMLFGDWNLGGQRVGNGVVFHRDQHVLCQSHRDAAVALAGDGLQSWHCGKAGENWGSNARYAVDRGQLQQQDLEIGDVNWAIGFRFDLAPGETLQKHWVVAMAAHEREALAAARSASALDFDEVCAARRQADAQWLQPGMEALAAACGQAGDQRGFEKFALAHAALLAAYKRSLLCLPLLCGDAARDEGVAVAAPEFDPEFIACGGYGYFWPRDGAEYVSGLQDAGYPQFALQLFDWCAQHQDARGLWHQRYFLNGSHAPNWCLPPDMLQVDQVGAVLWAFGKYFRATGQTPCKAHQTMVRQAADYLTSRLTERGVHANAFDTWETFVGSFTYSNASTWAALKVAGDVLGETKYAEAAQRLKHGVLKHFVRSEGEYSYLVRGFDAGGHDDTVVDSSSLGAIEPFGLLDLEDDHDLALAAGTLRAITERLECDWEGGRAIRRFEGDAYVGGVPACVNTLWMARCCLKVARRLTALDRLEEARVLTARAELYLKTVLHRATPTGLLPELMQGPEGQRWWAAPHGWAMASFVSGVLALAALQE